MDYSDMFLNSRTKTHGNFSDVAKVYDIIKTTLENGKFYHEANATQRTALNMIAYKLARIVSGNPWYGDHWKDVKGYAQLVLEHLGEDGNG